jgi:hypothetical protein
MKPSPLMLAVALLCAIAACRSPKEVPDPLVGTWKSPAAKYANSFLTITPNAITFGKEGETADGFPISAVRERHEGGDLLYEISFLTPEGDKQIFSFYYDALKGGQIRLVNQKEIVWAKQGS